MNTEPQHASGQDFQANRRHSTSPQERATWTTSLPREDTFLLCSLEKNIFPLAQHCMQGEAPYLGCKF